MADQVMTSQTELAAIIKEVWSASFHPTLVEALPMNELVSRNWEGEIRALGDTVNITRFPQFDVADELPEGAKSDADAITALNLPLVINKRVVKDYIVTDRADKQALEYATQLRDLAAHSISKKIQQNIFSDTVPSASAPDHQIAYDSGTTLALADILEAKELLDKQDVPDDGQRAMVVDAPQWNDLFNITGFTSRDFIPAGSPLTTGSFATNILGFQPRMTTEASEVSYFFHPLYFTMAIQEDMAPKVFDLGVDGVRAMRINMDVLYGQKQLDDLRVVTIS